MSFPVGPKQTGTSSSSTSTTSNNTSESKAVKDLKGLFEEKVTVSPRKMPPSSELKPSVDLKLRIDDPKKVKTEERKFPSLPQQFLPNFAKPSFPSPKLPSPALIKPPFPSPFELDKPDLSNNSEKQSSSEFKLKRDWEGSRTPKMLPPNAPRKPEVPKTLKTFKKGALEEDNDSRFSPFKLKYDELQKGIFQYNKETYKLSYLGKGNYSVVFSMKKTGLTGLIEDTGYVVKCYHGEYRTGFSKSHLNGYLASSISYYHTIKKLGLPVAEIFNAETASTDLFIIQQRIANPVNFSDPEQLKQVKEFFDAFCQHGVVMDLQPENFREEGGIVYLIDYLEEEEETPVRVKTSLKSWANLFYEKGVSRPEAEKMLTYLGQAFIDSGKHINANSIQEFLDN